MQVIEWRSSVDQSGLKVTEPSAIISGPFCKLAVFSDEEKVLRVEFLSPESEENSPTNRVAEEAIKQISRWLDDPQWRFSITLLEQGTEHQNRVWRALLEIPPGRPKTYGELANELGSGARAVGNACRANPCPIFVPCHRIVAASGLGGFAGQRVGMKIETKRWLLAHEGYQEQR